MDDEAPLHEAMAKMLGKTGFDVLEASDGYRDSTYSCGLGAPGMVMSSKKNGPEMITGAMSAPQIRTYLRKPFQLRDLLHTLRTSMSVRVGSADIPISVSNQ